MGLKRFAIRLISKELRVRKKVCRKLVRGIMAGFDHSRCFQDRGKGMSKCARSWEDSS
jgi:hypothetical protein